MCSQYLVLRTLISCPHTPQQNSLAERKHRSITELGLTLMFQSQVPQCLWVEAFFTANYLTNLLPSSVLQDHKSPYEVLMQQSPTYTALRVFGCKCFPHLKPYAANKLDPRSLPCVFLGYNDKYKGYRCYHPPTKRVYISRHVLFAEQAFPYADIYSQYRGDPSTSLMSAWRCGSPSEAVSPPAEPFTPPEIPTPIHHSEAPVEVDTPEIPVEVDPPAPEATSEESGSSSEGLIFSEDDFPPLSSTIITPPSSAPVTVVSAPVSVASTPAVAAPGHSMTTRAKDGIRKPNLKYALVNVKTSYQVPRTTKTALQDKG